MSTEPRAVDEATLYLYPANTQDMELSDVRVNGLAIMRWMNQKFMIREGMPCPVLFAAPMDAYAQFNRLWSAENNPYSYLRELEEFPGLEPAQLRFPLISIDWLRMRYRPEQSYATRVNRRLYWPTINSVQEGVTLADLGNVAQARMPSAWTHTYQVDFWCARPDTQAIFAKQLTNAFKVMSAGTPQTFIPVVYPGYFGALAERLVLSETVDNLTNREENDTEVRYRTSFTLDLEGYAVDQTRVITPTVWRILSTGSVVDPESLNIAFASAGIDLRDYAVENPIVIQRSTDMPPGPPALV